MTFDEWYLRYQQFDETLFRENILAAWNAAIAEASYIAMHDFGEDDVARAIDSLESK